MTDSIIPLSRVGPDEQGRFGGKCSALAGLAAHGFRVPDAVCIDSDLYRTYVTETDLLRKIHFELNRKKFQDMRWEEIWDAALRIRNAFATTEMSAGIREEITGAITPAFGEKPVVVRSSGAMEDSEEMSFAGLHESYVNIVGVKAILDHIKLVWASLWSDRALLYRQELGLDVEASAMSVVVQELVAGKASGVAFSRSPGHPAQVAIEAVRGLNQGLVDGTVEPDRWMIDRRTGRVISHTPAVRKQKMVASPGGVRLEELGGQEAPLPPLGQEEVAAVLDVALKAEEIFRGPQDVEWTIKDQTLYVLQSRPITAGRPDDIGSRGWYLTLTRSFENLKGLQKKIEGAIIPGMEAEAAAMVDAGLRDLSDNDLAEEIRRRAEAYAKWNDVYWKDCIPFAHGIRLFGQVYNDAVKPADPYEFMDLLSAASTIGVKRNRLLQLMAQAVRDDPALARDLESGAAPLRGSKLQILLDDYLTRFGGLVGAETPEQTGSDRRGTTLRLVLELARRPFIDATGRQSRQETLERTYLESFPSDRRDFAADLLSLARASYRWRDDDNIYLKRIESEVKRAVETGRERLRHGKVTPQLGVVVSEHLRLSLADAGSVEAMARMAERVTTYMRRPHGDQPGVRARQLTGQPAGPGIATGRARIVTGEGNLFDFKAREVLICDAIEPEITLIVPLASGIVERRGGMLIHGAIIAREYGIPCVTGVPRATEMIATGDTVTVDGYLGIVVLEGKVAQ